MVVKRAKSKGYRNYYGPTLRVLGCSVCPHLSLRCTKRWCTKFRWIVRMVREEA